MLKTDVRKNDTITHFCNDTKMQGGCGTWWCSGLGEAIGWSGFESMFTLVSQLSTRALWISVYDVHHNITSC